MAESESLEFSVVVPVYNESRILCDNITRMLAGLRTIGGRFELVICENGSSDESLRLAKELHRVHPEIRVEQLPSANYGIALSHGISASQHDIVVIFNIEFWDIDFLREALPKLEHYDIVIGSKRMQGARDRRPIFRRVITWSFNQFLRIYFGFHGTDTHGMKAFRKRSLEKILHKCVTDQWIFDTELVLRAERQGLRIIEIPIHVRELRQPDYWSLIKRTPRTFWNIVQLSRVFRDIS